MDSIFPVVTGIQNNNTLPMPKDIAIDFNTGKPIIIDDDFVIVEGNEAIKVWCYYALKIIKDKFIIYSPRYGSTLEELIGKNYEDNDKYALEKKIRECLLNNPYIVSVDKVNAKYDDNGILTGEIYITTIYSKGVDILNE